jgi:SAM-dependent methyltransferase
MSITSNVALWLTQRARDPRPLDDINELNVVLRQMAKWRSGLIANTYMQRHGRTILQGPFEGMAYVAAATEGALAPRLLGVYESELHPHIMALVASGLDCVVDIGCAEGYYAVGLARLSPELTVYAYDINPAARAACAELARANDVQDRVIVRGLFEPDGFNEFEGRRTLVFVDAEGAEDDVLQPDRSPALAGMTLIVETHDIFRPGVCERLKRRFGPTHEILQVDQQAKTLPLPDWLTSLGHLDQLLAVWEWRSAPTPWLIMTPRAKV